MNEKEYPFDSKHDICPLTDCKWYNNNNNLFNPCKDCTNYSLRNMQISNKYKRIRDE